MLDRINPHIGTDGRGNCLIGPCLPFGLVRLGPDTAFPHANSGYRPGKSLLGFSHMRMAGTGGASRYGHVRVMPLACAPKRLAAPPFMVLPATDRSWSKPLDERAALGEYHCRFGFGVDVDLTCTAHAGIHRYRFEPGTHPHVLIDLSSLLQGGFAPAGQAPYCEDWEMEGTCTGGRVELVSDREVAGTSEFLGGWGHFEPYRIYYFIRSRTPVAEFQLVNQTGPVGGTITSGTNLRAVLAYPESCREVELEVGISFSSVKQARHAVEVECGGRPWEALRDQAREAWRPWLDRIEVKGGTPDQQAILHTFLLRMFTMPTDLRGDGGKGFTDIVCLWDSIRNANSLQHLIAPDFSADLMNSLLEMSDESGWLPDTHIAGHFGYQQGGSNAEILFSEAARKGVPGVDYRRALAACVRNAETISDAPGYRGRYVEDYESLGYLSTRVPKSCVSRHIEYTYQDWCIARLAEHLGETETAARYDRKSQRIWNLWHEGHRAFMPKHPDCSWVAGIDPERPIADGWNDPHSYESSLAFWSYSALHVMPSLIERRGGAAAFVAHLDEFLSRHDRIEKETRMIVPHLYALAGRPDRTAAVISRSLATRYANSPQGLPDDEDMGCHSAYFIGHSTGLYPIYGQTIYSLVPPIFEESTLHYGKTGRSLTILREGDGPHIREVSINGSVLNGTLIEHSALADGGRLVIKL